MSEAGHGRRGVSRRTAVRSAGVGALAAGLGMAAAASPAAAQSSAASGIVGTWRVLLSIANTPNRDKIEFVAMFIPGGVFLVIDSPIEPASARIAGPDPVDYQGPHGGQWLQLPSGDVRARSLQLSYNQRAQVTHEEHAHYTLTYNGATDTIGGPFEWRELSPDGRVLLTRSGSISGTRVAVEG